MGLQDVFFQMRLPFDAPEARALSARISEEIYFHALVDLLRARRREGRAPGVRRDARRARRAAVRRLGRDADGHGALGRAARSASRPTACATRCWSPSRRPRPSPRSPAATSASSRRSRTCSSARRCRATSSRSTATWSPSSRRSASGPRTMRSRAQDGRGLRAGHRRAAGGAARPSTARPGRSPCASLIDMAADRGAFIDQSQSLNLFMESPTIGKLSSHVHLRLEEGPQDDLLPALAPGDAHRQGDGGDAVDRRSVAARSRPEPRRSPARSRTRRRCEACQ